MKVNTTHTIPAILQDALPLVEKIFHSNEVIWRRFRQRAMRSDRRNNLIIVISVLLQNSPLHHEDINNLSILKSRPLTIPEIAMLAQICSKTVFRCIEELIDLGLIEKEKIKWNLENGQIRLRIGLEHFTEKFWSSLGIVEVYKKIER